MSLSGPNFFNASCLVTILVAIYPKKRLRCENLNRESKNLFGRESKRKTESILFHCGAKETYVFGYRRLFNTEFDCVYRKGLTMGVMHMFRAVVPRKKEFDLPAIDLSDVTSLRSLIRPTLDFQAQILNSSRQNLRRRGGVREEEFEPGPRPPTSGEILPMTRHYTAPVARRAPSAPGSGRAR